MMNRRRMLLAGAGAIAAVVPRPMPGPGPKPPAPTKPVPTPKPQAALIFEIDDPGGPVAEFADFQQLVLQQMREVMALPYDVVAHNLAVAEKARRRA